MTHSTRFTLITLIVLMGFLAMGLLAGCDKHGMRCRCDKCYNLDSRFENRPGGRYDREFRPPPPRPVRYRGEDRDDFEDRMDDWEDDYEDWEDDYEDWLEDRREEYEDRQKDRREAYEDRYDRRHR